ncbi:ImmA/IrrE family metallo-endopeptidase [Emcibacter nanhaiensis]|uniref:ImmA/IrrE family metallo-endopeptidase n=1 Tax=Emcibacter nanhaiensis TaxID=1505037 RepID=A0A501PBN0_9PROT|nr:ImmA/IrrE family metallo-endopeptidase [Emcibacter nanhaiensis]TPD57386.1 ImmA/IrrE family metallo-endopeptidase [Emcibacter nanhaiensis]
MTPEQSKIVEKYTAMTPVAVGALAKELGLSVKSSSLHANISGEIRPDPSNRGSFIIKVNRHEPKTRQRFTVAHEIAHYLLHEDLIGDGISDDILYRSSQSNKVEAEANRLAAAIVMPWESIKVELEKIKSLSDEEKVTVLSEIFNVSQVAMRIRLGFST